jgi:HPr kinase/phosphorylase
MNPTLTAEALFEQLKDRLGLEWSAGQAGGKRLVESLESQHMRPSLVGFLNLVHPNTVQILGIEEIKYLDSLDARKRWESVADIVGENPAALIVTDGEITPDDLIESANETATPIWSSSNTSIEVVSRIQHHLARVLAQVVTVHGVYMEVFSIGVLVTGDSGSGKSELALELISRGHRLVADDAPLMTVITPEIIDGTCPEMLQDCLEVRGLGVLNVRAMFGDSAIVSNKYLKLIIHLKILGPEDIGNASTDRLHGDIDDREIMGIPIPQITIPVAPGRNIAVLVEAAVRNHSLKLKGFDAANEFLDRHQAQLSDPDDDV